MFVVLVQTRVEVLPTRHMCASLSCGCFGGWDWGVGLAYFC